MTTTKERTSELASQMESVDLTADSPEVDEMIATYRAKFNLPARSDNRLDERATVWRGVKLGERVIAVFGERLEGRRLEITDAYYDDTQEGRTAFLTMCYGYYGMLTIGEIDQLVHVALYANKDHWEAIVRETGDQPHALIFVHERKAPA